MDVYMWQDVAHETGSQDRTQGGGGEGRGLLLLVVRVVTTASNRASYGSLNLMGSRPEVTSKGAQERGQRFSRSPVLSGVELSRHESWFLVLFSDQQQLPLRLRLRRMRSSSAAMISWRLTARATRENS